MPITRVVILGGGPIGLLCAIEAKRCFEKVVIIEKRGGYSRTNVPSLNNALINHLKTIEVADTLWPTGQAGASVAFSKLEEALWRKAQSMGVVMERGFTITNIVGDTKMGNGRFKRIRLTLAPWDDRNKRLVPQAPTRELLAGLLVVASGGSAARDALICQTLGFSFTSLKAKNYAAYGIFEAGQNDDPKDFVHISKFVGMTNEIVSGKIAFETLDHNYLLVTLSQCTKTDFKLLQQNSKAFHTLLKAVAEGFHSELLQKIKDVEKNTGLFKVSIQRARHFYSRTFPAVIVGDAAVTPHPEAGSGMTTGFAGVQQIAILFEALRGVSRSVDSSAAWLSFNQSYELFVSKKALEGTRIILRNLNKLLLRFIADARQVAAECRGSAILEPLEKMIKTADILHDVLKLRDWQAENLLKILNGDAPNFDWKKCGADQLWSDIGIAYKAIKALTNDIALFGERLEKVELALATKSVTGKEMKV